MRKQWAIFFYVGLFCDLADLETNEVRLNLRPGDRLNLQCPVSTSHDDPDLIWLWTHPTDGDTVIISHTLVLLHTDPRFKVSMSEDGRTYGLNIKGVRTNDSGTYLCQMLLEDTSHQVLASVHLSVSNSASSYCSVVLEITFLLFCIFMIPKGT